MALKKKKWRLYIEWQKERVPDGTPFAGDDAGPISGFGTRPASTQSRFSVPGHPFAMMRAEIRKNPRPVAALRTIKTGLRRYYTQKQ